MAKILDVAQYVCEYYFEMTRGKIDKVKLHALLYFCQREKLALLDEPLFEESMKVQECGFVSDTVTMYFDQGTGIICRTNEISDEDKYIVRNVLMQYGNISLLELCCILREEISWKNSKKSLLNGQDCGKNVPISDIKKDAEKVRPYDCLWDMFYDELEDIEKI